jgi:preprotein translocase subunit SecB
MKLSPLQLEHYFVAESHVTASRQFKSDEPAAIRAENIEIDHQVKPTAENRQWEVNLRVQFTPGPEVNTPYFFTIELVGFFRADATYLPDRLERLVATNGPTILFGIAREVVRNLTGHGPHPPMILPTASFVLERKLPSSTAVVDAQPVESGPVAADNS